MIKYDIVNEIEITAVAMSSVKRVFVIVRGTVSVARTEMPRGCGRGGKNGK